MARLCNPRERVPTREWCALTERERMQIVADCHARGVLIVGTEGDVLRGVPDPRD
jgi:hypothetical protein